MYTYYWLNYEYTFNLSLFCTKVHTENYKNLLTVKTYVYGEQHNNILLQKPDFVTLPNSNLLLLFIIRQAFSQIF